jgi:hypothetical protein
MSNKKNNTENKDKRKEEIEEKNREEVTGPQPTSSARYPANRSPARLTVSVRRRQAGPTGQGRAISFFFLPWGDRATASSTSPPFLRTTAQRRWPTRTRPHLPDVHWQDLEVIRAEFMGRNRRHISAVAAAEKTSSTFPLPYKHS